MSNISVTICGQGGCGKSSITLRFVCNQWDQGYDPTIEDRYTVVRTVDGVTYTLNLTDTAGQEEYRELWRLSRVQSDAFLLVYDITQPGSLEALELFNQTVEAQCQAAMDLGHVVPVCLVVGNKSDLESTRRVPIQDGFVWAHARGYGFVEASARTNSNIEQIFTSLVRNVRDARQRATLPVRGSQFAWDEDSHAKIDGHAIKRHRRLWWRWRRLSRLTYR